jgi:hypothetical protein
MRPRLTPSWLFAFAVGALSDVFLIRNGLSYSGQTLLDRYPVLWAVWLAGLFIGALYLGYRRASPQDENPVRPARGPAVAMWLGVMVTHLVLFIRDVIADPTSHNLWPFEFLFWGIVVAAPVFSGALLATIICKRRNAAPPR